MCGDTKKLSLKLTDLCNLQTWPAMCLISHIYLFWVLPGTRTSVAAGTATRTRTEQTAGKL